MIISFLGPDGSGKTTIIELVKENSLFSSCSYFHLKPISIVNNDVIESEIVTDPHRNLPYSKFMSYLKILYFICQYNIGWFKNISVLRGRSSLIIFDRYFDDILIDYKRYRYSGKIGFVKFARNFIPKPDIYFILTADAKVIHARKQEVCFEELQRQVYSYKSLADGKRYFEIDVNRTPEQIAKEIFDIMMMKMNEKC